MENLFYRVKGGDTLLSVSAKFTIPASVIIADNNLKSEIAEGDILYLRKTEGRVYLVKPSDTISEIAKSFNVKEEEILEKNKIPYVFAGETIIIP